VSWSRLRDSLVLDSQGASNRRQSDMLAPARGGRSKQAAAEMEAPRALHMSPMHGIMGESDRLDMGVDLPPARPHPGATPTVMQHAPDTPSPPPRASGAAVRQEAPERAGGAAMVNGQDSSSSNHNKGMMRDATAAQQQHQHAAPHHHQPSAQHHERGGHQRMEAPQAQMQHPPYVPPPAQHAQWGAYPQPGAPPQPQPQQPHFPLQGPQYVQQGHMLMGQVAVGPSAAPAAAYEQGRAAPAAAGETDMEWEIDNRDLVFGKLLGSGTFGDVYKGKWLGSDVAIKVLRVTRALDETQVSPPSCPRARQSADTLGWCGDGATVAVRVCCAARRLDGSVSGACSHQRAHTRCPALAVGSGWSGACRVSFDALRR